MGVDDLGDLNTHACTPEELGVEGDNSSFWPINPISYQDISFYRKKMKCSDDYISINGDFNSNKATRLEIYFEKCNPEKRATCHTEEEIAQWIKRKFIMVFHNQERFDDHAYGQDRIIKESILNWIPMNSQIRSYVGYKVKLTEV